MESVAVRLDNYVDVSMKETFREFLRSSTNTIINNIYSEKNKTVKLHIFLIKNNKIVTLAADKESCTVILNKNDYIRKISNIIKEGTQQDKYIKTIDTTQCDLKLLQIFFAGILKNQNIMKKFVQFLTNHVDSLQVQKHRSLHH